MFLKHYLVIVLYMDAFYVWIILFKNTMFYSNTVIKIYNSIIYIHSVDIHFKIYIISGDM